MSVGRIKRGECKFSGDKLKAKFRCDTLDTPSELITRSSKETSYTRFFLRRGESDDPRCKKQRFSVKLKRASYRPHSTRRRRGQKSSSQISLQKDLPCQEIVAFFRFLFFAAVSVLSRRFVIYFFVFSLSQFFFLFRNSREGVFRSSRCE